MWANGESSHPCRFRCARFAIGLFLACLLRCANLAAATSDVPDWESEALVWEKVGETSIRISWSPPNDGGSAVIGYTVWMEANGDGVWETVYDGTNEPGTLQYLATGLHANIEYKFQVYAENRNGQSAANELTITLLDYMASPQSSILTMPTEVTSDVAYTIEIQGANPLTGEEETEPGRLYAMSVHDVCELDLTETLCIRVQEGHPDYTDAVQGTPKYTIHSQDVGGGRYLFTDTLRTVGNYSVLLQAIEPGGLLGQYWDNQWHYGHPVLTRQDPDLDFNWGLGTIAVHASDFASVRWTGFVMPDYTETYRFYVEADDSARLWVDGVLIFDKFDQCCQEWWGEAPLVAGELSHILLEYREVTGFARMKFQWSSFSQMKSTIPPGQLYKAPFVQGSPFMVEVGHGSASAARSFAYGDALELVRCLRTYTFHIQARDAADNLLQTNGELFTVNFQGPSETVTVESESVQPEAMDGLYRVDFRLYEAGTYNVRVTLSGQNILDSPFTLIARPGGVSPLHSTTEAVSEPSATEEFTAGTEAEFIVQARDAESNPSDEDVGQVTCAIEWLNYDRTTQPTVVDDEDLNTAQYGKYFFGTAVYLGSGRYRVRYTALREGTHKMYVSINGLNVSGSPFDLTGYPAAEAYGPKCITEEAEPAETGTAGTEYNFFLQLRDAFGNFMTATREEDEPTVRLTALTMPTSSVDEGVCEAWYYGNDQLVTTSLWFCKVTPTVAGDRLLSAQVNGVEVSSLNVSNGEVVVKNGPFPVYIEPASPTAANTLVYNVLDEYTAGQTAPALVQLRDQYDNNLTELPSDLRFRAQFGPTRLETEGEDWYDNGNGTIIINVGTFLAEPTELEVYLYENPIGNSPTDEVDVVPTEASANGTYCDTPSIITADVDTSFVCYPRDENNNAVNDNTLFIYAEFRNMDNTDAPVVTVRGVYSSASDPVGLYDMPVRIADYGDYSVVIRLWVQHGLLASYYRTPGFTTLIPGLSDLQHQGESNFLYTKVDEQLNMWWPEEPVATAANDYWSARWQGYLLPKHTGIYTLRIESEYAVRVTLGEDVVIDEFDARMAVRSAVQVVLTEGEPEPLVVEYIHNAGTGFLRLYWASTQFEDELIPSANLLHPLNVLDADFTTEVPIPETTTTTTTTELVAGPVSATNTLVEGAGATAAVAGDEAIFYLTMRDENDMNTGIAADTLTVSQNYMEVTYLGEGVYMVNYTRTAAGTIIYTVRVDGVVMQDTPGYTEVTVSPRPVDPTTDEVYYFSSTTFVDNGLLQEGVTQEVTYFARDVYNNFNTDVDDIAMICEADGPVRHTAPYRLPLDIVDVASTAGSYLLSMVLDMPGDYLVDCYAAKQGGMNARYFNNRFVEGEPANERIETSINFDWGQGLVSEDAVDFVSAQYDGWLRVPSEANYTFYVTTDDGAKMWLDDSLLLSMDTPGQMETEEVLLTGTRLYHIQLMFYERTGFSQFRLEWSNDEDLSREVIAEDYLYHSRTLLGDFPQSVRVWNTPGQVEAFYHYDFAHDVNSLAWNAPLDNGGQAITGYDIFRDDGNGGDITDDRGNFDAATFELMETFSNEANLQFMYKIVPKSDGGDGESVTITAQPTTAPDKPEQALLIGGGNGTLSFRFTPYTGATAGYATIVGYSLWRNEGLGGILHVGYSGEMDGSSTEELTISGLVHGRVYLFQTAYETFVAQSELSNVAMVVCCDFSPPQAAPLNVRRSGDQLDDKIEITWDAVTETGSSSLIYYRCYIDDGSGETYADTDTGDDLVHTFDFLTGGEYYRIQVAAVNAAGVGPRSERMTFVSSDEPYSPENVKADFQSREKITISWERPSFVGAAGMSGYLVYVDDGDGGDIDNLIYNGPKRASTFSYTWEPKLLDGSTALTAGATYRFQVQGVNAAGTGLISDTLEVVAATKPLAPGRPYSDTSQTDTEYVYVSWTAPDDGGSPILGYIVERWDPDRSEWLQLTTNSSDPLQTDTTYADNFGIVENEAYTYRIWAFNVITTGDDVIGPEAVLYASAAPDAPDLSFVSSDETSIAVEWTLPTSDTSPLPSTGFKLYINRALTYDGTGVPTKREYTLVNCTTGGIYDFHVVAMTSAGESELSDVLSLFCARRPYAPPQPRMKSAGRDYIEIEWDPPTDNGGMAVTGYKVQRASYDSFTFSTDLPCLQDDASYLTTLPSETLTCWDDDAASCTDRTCKYEVLAMNGIEDSNYEDASPSLTALAADLPDPPAALTRNNNPTDATEIEVTWSAVSGDSATGGADILGYIVYANTGIDDSLFVVYQQWTPSVRNFTHRELVPGRRYWYQVSAVNPTGEGEKSNVAIFLAAAMPSAPPKPRFIDALEKSITLAFDAPPYDGGSRIMKYVIYHNDGTATGQLTTEVHICNTSVQEYEVQLQEPGRDYQFQIQAHGECPYGAVATEPAAGYSAPECDSTTDCTLGGPLSAISLFTASGLPDSLSIEEVSDSATRDSLSFRWTPFDPITDDDGGTIIIAYETYHDNGLGGDLVKVESIPASYSDPYTNVEITQQEYTFTGLVTGRTYTFRIDACNKRGCTIGALHGGGASGAPLAIAAPPDAPFKPSATSTSEQYINITITPGDNGGLVIMHYKMERDDGVDGSFASDWWPDAIVNAADPTFVDYNVTASLTYRYRVQAVNARGTSDYSTIATFVAAGVPGQMDDLTLVSQSKTAIELQWAAPSNNNGADVTEFILYQDDGLGSALQIVYQGSALTYTSEGLVTGLFYAFQVSAVNAAGAGPLTDRQLFRAAQMPSTVGVPLLRESECATGTVKLKWTGPLDDGGCAIEGYRVHKNGDTNPETDITIEEVATHLYFEATGLTCGEENYWTVQTKNCLETWGSESPALTTYATDAPGQVLYLNATDVSPTQLEFLWTRPADVGSLDSTHLRGYELYLDDGMGGAFTRVYDGYDMPYEVSYIASDLTTGLEYRAYVRAMGIEWPGPDSEIIYKIMAVEPGAPRQLEVTSTGNKSVECTWLPPLDTGGVPVMHYLLEYAPEPLFETWVQEDPIDNTAFVAEVDGLVMGSLYQFRIRAVNDAGEGSYSNVVPYIVGTPPLISPSGLAMASTTLTSIHWTWDAVEEEDAGGAPLGGYRLYMNTGRNDATQLIYDGDERPAITQFNATGLTCGLEYVAEVSAVTRIGEGPRSSQVAFTLASYPSEPRNVVVSYSSGTTIELAWDIPEQTGCAEIYAYQIERDSGFGFEARTGASTLSPTKTFEDTDNLVPGQVYIYRISARNVNFPQYGPYSSYVTAFAAELPGAVSNVEYKSSTRDSVSLRWEPPSFDGGATIRHYTVQADDGFGGAFADAVTVTVPFATVNNVVPGRTYRFRVNAFSDVGGGPYAPTYTQAVAALPDAPATPTLETVSGYKNRVRVVWEEPSDNGGSVVLGYQVVFDGSCIRYDGSSIGSVTQADIRCVAGTTSSITVQARNIVGYGEHSPAVARACGAEPGYPQNLRLATAAPLLPLGLVDLRTPTTLTLTWDLPADDGGVSVSWYRLFRDNGDASGIYNQVYEGVDATVTLTTLTTGYTYRFYVMAFNGVGWGQRSGTFAARMECVPRAPTSAPTRTSSNPWSITITWPESADDCGATVTGYRVYRDAVLIYPVSNNFASSAVLDTEMGWPTTDSLSLKFTSEVIGRAWVVVIDDPDGKDRVGFPPLVMSPQLAKLRTTAVGRSTCQWHSVPIDDTETVVNLHGCEFMSEGYYAAYVYVESADGLDDDGTLSDPIRFQVPEASNVFTQGPTMGSNPTEDSVLVEFTAKSSAGYAWLMIVEEDAQDAVTIRSMKAFAGALGDTDCQRRLFVNQLAVELNLTGCDLNATDTYKLFVYVEDGQGMNDGTMPAPLTFQIMDDEEEAVTIITSVEHSTVPDGQRSNSFAVSPTLEGVVTDSSEVSMTFRATASYGRMWAVAVSKAEGDCMTVRSIKLLTGAVCQRYNVPINAGTRTVTLRNCGFVGGRSYSAFVYVEDEYGLDDGVLSAALEFTVPYSNRFTDGGVSAVSSTITPSGLTLKTSVEVAEGYRWAMIVLDRHSTYVDAHSIKAGIFSIGGPNCWQNGVDIMASTETFSLRDCALTRGETYQAFVYVEGPNATENDGSLSSPVEIMVPSLSVLFTEGPALTMTPLPERLGFDFNTDSGDTPGDSISARLWVVVTTVAGSQGMTKYTIKSTTHGVGGCKLSGSSFDTLDEQDIILRGCDLRYDTTYVIFIYVEDSNGQDDGELRSLQVTTIPGLNEEDVEDMPNITNATPLRSNWFERLPEVVVPVMAHSVTFNFTLDSAGFLWAAAVLPNQALTVEEVMSGSSSICSLSSMAVAVGYGEATLSGCQFEAATTYGIEVYVTGSGAGIDGTLSGVVDFILEPSSTFQQEPHLTEVPRPSEIEITFTASADGQAWITVLNETMSGFTVMAAKYGGEETAVCHLGPYNVTGGESTEIDISSCSLMPLDPWMPVPYELYVYIEDDASADDGSISMPLLIEVPTSNNFLVEPFIVEVLYNGSGVTFFLETTVAGQAWAAIFSTTDGEYATVADLKQTSEATRTPLGGASCQLMNATTDSAMGEQLSLTGCTLTLSRNYALLVYVEDFDEADDGALSRPVVIMVPTSNSFVSLPSMTVSAVEDGISFEFEAETNTGQAWAQLFYQTSDASDIDLDDLRNEVCTAPANGELLCAGTCMKSDIIGDVTNYWTLQGCDLIAGTTYTLALYVEDGDMRKYGSLALLDFTVPSNASNYFTEIPRVLNSSLSSDGLEVTYRGYESSGVLWATIVENDGTSVDVTRIKRGTGSVGASGCKHSELVIDNSFRSLEFTDCEITNGRDYRVLIYIEGPASNHLNNGDWFSLHVTVPAVNEFTLDPLLLTYTDRAVTKGQAHIYNVRAVNSAGAGIPSADSASLLVAGLPAAPAIPIIGARTQSSVNLQWSPPATRGAEILYYRLFMGTNTLTDDFQEIYSGPDTFFTKSLLTTGTTYRFKVSAVNIIGEGPSSPSREAAVCTVPSAPNPVLVSSRSTTSIIIEWAAPAIDGGCTISSYVVRFDGVDQPEQSQTVFATAAGAVTTGPTYDFEVRAVNGAGSSAYSDLISVIAAEAPAQVENLTSVLATVSGITLSWSKIPSAAHGGSPLYGYRVYQTTLTNGLADGVYVGILDLTFSASRRLLETMQTAGRRLSDTVDEDDPEFTISLAAGTHACFKVGGLNLVSDTNPLNDQNPKLSDAVCGYAVDAPTPPTTLYVQRQVVGTVLVFWLGTPDDGGSSVSLWELTLDRNSAGIETIATLASINMEFTYVGCEAGDELSFTVRGHNVAGWGSYSSGTSILCAAAPDTMDAPTRLDSTRDSITPQWTAPAADNGAPVVAYKLYQATGTAGDFSLVYQGLQLSYASTGLTNGETYRFKVSAVNEAGEGTLSSEVSIVCAGPPSAVYNIQQSDDTGTSVRLSWSAPTDNGGVAVTHYEVRYCSGTNCRSADSLKWTGTDTQSDVLIFGAGSSVLLEVWAYNDMTLEGQGTKSTAFWWYGAVCGLAEEVNSFAASDFSITDTSVTFSWTALDTAGCVQSYDIYYKTSSSIYSLAQSVGPSVYSVNIVLTRGETYDFQITVCTVAGCTDGYPDGGLSVYAGAVPTFENETADAISLVEATLTTIEVEWIALDGYDVTDYELWYDAGNISNIGNAAINPVCSGTATSCKLDPLTTGVEYSFQVRAKNADGWGPLSAVYAFATSPVPSDINNLTWVSSTSDSIQVGWLAPERAENEVYLHRYEVEWGVAGASASQVITTAVSNLYAEPIGLTAGVWYRFRVRACNLNGCSSYSAGGTGDYLDLLAGELPEAPSTPTQGTASNPTTEVEAEWDYVGKSNGGVALTHYVVKVSRDSGATYTDEYTTTDATVQSQTVACGAAATPPTELYVKVAAVNGVGGEDGQGPATTGVRMICEDKPGQPDAPVLSSTSSSLTVTLDLDSSLLNDVSHTGWVIWYDNIYDGGSTYDSIEITDTSLQSYTISTGIVAGDAYRVKLQLCSLVGCSDESGIAGPQVAASEAEAPVDVSVGARSNSEVTVEWNFTGSDGGVPLLGWYVYVSSDGTFPADSQYSLTDPSASSYTVPCSVNESDSGGVVYDRDQEFIWIRVAGFTSRGAGAESSTLATRCSALPATPSAPTLKSSSSSAITIAYTGPSATDLNGAYHTGFQVQYDDGAGGAFIEASITSTQQLEYTLSTVTAGQTYRFRVLYESEVGLSAASPTVSFLAAALPSAPTVSVIGSSLTSVTLSWTAGTDGGSTVTSWYVYGSNSSRSDSWPALTDPFYTTATGTTTQVVSCTDTSVWGGDVSGKYIYLRVVGENDAGIGTRSSSIRWRCTRAPEQPDAPGHVSGTETSITISYAKKSMYDAAHTGFLLEYDDGVGGSFSQISIASTSQVEYTFAGLSAGLTYRFRVSVNSEVGYSDASSITSIVCGDDPDAPDAPSWISSVSSSEIIFGWSFSGSTGGTAIQSWSVFLATDITTWGSAHASVAFATTQYQLDCTQALINDVTTDLTAGDRYVYVKIAAVTLSTSPGTGPDSPISRLHCEQQPAAPTVSDSSGTSTSITVTWTLDTSSLYSTIIAYKAYISDGVGSEPSHVGTVSDTSDLTYTFGGLTTSYTYEIAISVVTVVGESELSTSIDAYACDTPDEPSAPARDSANCGVTTCDITLTWVAPADNGCPLLGYRIEDGSGSLTSLISSGSTSGDVTGVAVGTSDTYRVIAYNARGGTSGDYTYLQAADVPDQTSTPYQTTEDIENSGPEKVALTWTTPDLNGGTAVGYKVYRNSGLGTSMQTVADSTCGMETNPAPPSCTVTGLSYGETYQFQVLTINDAGDGPLSAIAVIQASSIPAVMDAPTVSAQSSSPSLTFTWVAPDSQGSQITHYIGTLTRVSDGKTYSWDCSVWAPLKGLTTDDCLTLTSVTFLDDDAEPAVNVTILEVGYQYTFAVAAVNARGTQSLSDASNTTASPSGYTLDAPDDPTNFGRNSAVTAVEGTISLTWDLAATSAEAGADELSNVDYNIEGYLGTVTGGTLQYSATVSYETANLSSPVNYDVTVTAGETWTFRIQATNVGNVASNWVESAQLASAAVPTGVQLLSASSTTTGVTVVTWDPPATSVIPVLEYLVSNDNFATYVTVDNTDLTYTFSGETSGATVTYSVKATNAVGEGAQEDTSTVVA